MVDRRKLEAVLARVFREHGVHTSEFHGVHYIGLCSTEVIRKDDLPHNVRVPTMPQGRPVSLEKLARDIAEAMA